VSEETVLIRVLFADEGAFHHEELRVPAGSLQGYDRLIDGLREDPQLLKLLYLDVGRLCGAWIVPEER
jgi:hypothetical protein